MIISNAMVSLRPSIPRLEGDRADRFSVARLGGVSPEALHDSVLTELYRRAR